MTPRTTDDDSPCSPGPKRPRARRRRSRRFRASECRSRARRIRVDRYRPFRGREVARSRQLGHAVGAADRAAETLGESLDHRGRDRRAAGIEMVEAREMRGRRLRSVHQRDERGDRADDECRPMFEKRLQHDGGLETIGQDLRGARREGARRAGSRNRSHGKAARRQRCATRPRARRCPGQIAAF